MRSGVVMQEEDLIHLFFPLCFNFFNVCTHRSELIAAPLFKRGCFIVHRDNVQLLGISVCYHLLSQHKHRENEGVKITRENNA
jgi:hypothetical protein